MGVCTACRWRRGERWARSAPSASTASQPSTWTTGDPSLPLLPVGGGEPGAGDFRLISDADAAPPHRCAGSTKHSLPRQLVLTLGRPRSRCVFLWAGVRRLLPRCD